MQELEKGSNEVTSDHCNNIRSRRFNFGVKQSQLYICSTIALAIVILTFVLIQMVFYNSSENNFESQTNDLSRKEYVKYIQNITENDSIDPCDNFYKFACQTWQKENRKPEMQNKWTVFAVQYYKIHKLVLDILEEAIQDNEIDAVKQAKMLYRKCLNDSTRLQSILKGTFGQTGYPAINELCKDSIKNIFNIALAHKIAVLKYGEMEQLESIKTEIQQMFENIRHWFSGMDTRSSSNSIIQTKLCVGLPDWIFNRTRVQAEYSELNLDTTETFSHQLVAANHWLRKLISEREANPNSECPWADSMGYDGAYYLRSTNLIYLPIGFLELPYFSLNQSQEQNYGSLGSVIGHELAHAYLVPNSDSIKNSTLNCLQSQYNSLSGRKLKNQRIPLRLDPTIHENLADNLGLTVAYNTRFRIGTLRDAHSQSIDTLIKNKHSGPFTDEQSFFLSFAQKWCELPPKNVLWLDEHSTGMTRVMGALQNSNEFAKAWNCPVGSAMNPLSTQHRKCQLV